MESGAETIRILARVLRATGAKDISPAAMRAAQLLLLDTIGCGIAGIHEDVARSVADVALREGGTPVCAIIGRTQRTSIVNVVLANGVSIRVLDLNDYLITDSKGQPETGGHPSDNIPVALAVGHARGRSGADVLTSIVIGYELYARLQSAMDRNGQWDSVTVSGLVAPAMAGWLMGLDETKLAHAIALGAARAATPAIVRTGHISAAKSIANALIAQSGVQAALLAEAGLTGPLPILDDARGLRDLFAKTDPSHFTAAIPADGGVLRAHVKVYPCVNTGQAAVAAALKLRAKLGDAIQDLAHIEIVMADYPAVRRHQEDKGRARPQSREAADHSFPFLVAVALIDGTFGIAQFENERWHDPRVTRLMEKITMRRDAEWNARAPGGFPCTLRAQNSQGHEFLAEIPYAPGFSHDGIDRAATLEKFHAVTAPWLGQTARTQIVDAVMAFPETSSTTPLDTAIATEGTPD